MSFDKIQEYSSFQPNSKQEQKNTDEGYSEDFVTLTVEQMTSIINNTPCIKDIFTFIMSDTIKNNEANYDLDKYQFLIHIFRNTEILEAINKKYHKKYLRISQAMSDKSIINDIYSNILIRYLYNSNISPDEATKVATMAGIIFNAFIFITTDQSFLFRASNLIIPSNQQQTIYEDIMSDAIRHGIRSANVSLSQMFEMLDV